MKLTIIGGVLKKAFPIDGSKQQGLPAPAHLVPFVLDESIVPALLRFASEDDSHCPASPEDERAIIEGIRRQRLWSTGDQMDMDGVVASIGGRTFDFSYRGWGALLSRAWCGTDEHYTVFAWGAGPGMEAPPDVVRVPTDSGHMVKITDGRALNPNVDPR